MTTRFPGRRLTTIAGLATALLLVGCQAGPQSVPAGSYRLLADATTTSPATPADLTITADAVTLTVDGTASNTNIGAATSDYLLCPPSGKGTARALSTPLTINGTEFTHPAIYGDCGQAKPTRVTIIDLDSHNDGATKPPFTRWAEFCNTTDPDC